jgi:cell division protein ZapA
MSEQPSRVSVRILEKEYFVACGHEERADLLDCAEYLSGKMREIRDTGKVVGLDRIAVMAALNMANELLKKGREQTVSVDLGARLRRLTERVDSVLGKGRQFEL